jgi:thiamine-monophosphate kinase
MPGEFDLIQRYFTKPSQRSDVLLSVGDDCALLQVPAGQVLAISTDTLHAGVHFPHGTDAYDIGWKSLAVNLSDLAAVGAVPAWATLAISVPTYEEAWLQAFSDGFFALANTHQLALIGGDTTRGPLSITITIHGFIPPAQALRRDAACVGDIIAVTGTLGDAGRALQHALDELPIIDSSDCQFLLSRLNRPTPRVQTALALREYANAAIDISDGLIQDLQHVLNGSQVGAMLTLEQLPLSTALRRQSADEATALNYALSCGDDYELCLTIPAAHWSQAQATAIASGVNLTAIGEVIAGPPVLQLLWRGQVFDAERAGYDHFGAMI